MSYSNAVTYIIRKRYSCRSYTIEPIAKEKIAHLERFIESHLNTPGNTTIRAKLVVANEEEQNARKKLGTYGVIQHPAAFIIMAVAKAENALFDVGYALEKAILCATDLGLGSCWIGGSFHKSHFSKRIAAREHEIVPAVVSLGNIASKTTIIDSFLRFAAKAKTRKSWEEIFFHNDFDTPLSSGKADKYADVLEMVRLAPSADNNQPWRIVKARDKNIFHLYLRRSKSAMKREKLLKLADLQKIDVGVAMSHFELTAHELKLNGAWRQSDPGIQVNDKFCEYVITWIG